MNKQLLLTFLFMMVSRSYAQQEISLYGGTVPNSKVSTVQETHKSGTDGVTRIAGVTQPTLTVFRPVAGKANGTAVVICPGGGYAILAWDHEGTLVAERFAAQGITAFVLKYRLPTEETMIDKSTGPLQDAQAAILWVRSHAEAYQVNVNRVGIMGFSAGGHLASTAATHFRHAYIDNPDQVNLRPDFQLLLYPVISMGPLTHTGSRNHLLGKNAPDSLSRLFSNELQVTKETPPAFLVHAEDDGVVPVENSIQYVLALKANGVGATLHLYEKGGHGFGLNNNTTSDAWWDRLTGWLKDHQLL